MPRATFAVWAPCAERRELQPTHARMTERQFSHFKGELVFWCADCRMAHRSAAKELRLSGEVPGAPAPSSPIESAVKPSAFASA